jgi:hypothetical protein
MYYHELYGLPELVPWSMWTCCYCVVLLSLRALVYARGVPRYINVSVSNPRFGIFEAPHSGPYDLH